jgi:hypothetical protein
MKQLRRSVENAKDAVVQAQRDLDQSRRNLETAKKFLREATGNVPKDLKVDV